MLGLSAWPSFLTKFSGILQIWLVTRINPDHNQLLLHFHVSRCSHRKATTGWELKWDSEPLDTGFHFLVKIQDYSFCINSSVLQKQEIGAAHTYQACSHSQSPNAACSTWAAGLDEAGCPRRSLEKDTTEVGVRSFIPGAGGWFVSRCWSFLLLLVNCTEICSFHKDLLPWTLLIH